MKFIVVLISVLFLSQMSFAEGDPVGRNYKFDRDFKKALEQIDSVTGSEKILSLGDRLDTYIKRYPRDWRTYYWKAFSEYVASQALLDNAKIEKLDSATYYLDRAEYLIKNNSECQILRAFVLHERILANPEVNQAKYGKDLAYYKNYSYRSNQSNPRFLLLEGIIHLNDTLGKPENKELAIKYFSGADYLYKKGEVSKYEADPFWGQERVDVYLTSLGVSTGAKSFDEQIMNELESDIDEKQTSVAEREEELKEKAKEQQENVEEVDELIEKLDENLKDDKKDKKGKKKKDKKKKK